MPTITRGIDIFKMLMNPINIEISKLSKHRYLLNKITSNYNNIREESFYLFTGYNTSDYKTRKRLEVMN